MDESVAIKKADTTVTLNAKSWHPIAWALGTSKIEYLTLLYTTMQPHLQHALDINPAKTLYQAEESGKYSGKISDSDSLFLNKGKC